MAVLIGNSNDSDYALTTGIYASTNGEMGYLLSAANSGNANALFIRISSFNTTTNLKILVRDSLGNLLASGIIPSSGGTGVRSVSVTPFTVTAGQNYRLSIIPNTGSPRPFQNSLRGTVSRDTSSTYAATEPVFVADSIDSGLRQFHMWVDGDIVAVPTIDTITSPVRYGAASSWTTSTFTPAPNAGTLDSVAMSGVSASGFAAFNLVDGATVPRVGTRTATATNGTQSASISTVVDVPATMNWVQLVDPLDTSEYSALPAGAVAGAWMLWFNTLNDQPTNTVIYSDGAWETSVNGSQTVWYMSPSGVLSEGTLMTGGGFVPSTSDPKTSLSLGIGFGIGI